jgi:CheY-like chemotaxis protein
MNDDNLTENYLINNDHCISLDEEERMARKMEAEDRNMQIKKDYQNRILATDNICIKRNILIIEDNQVVITILKRFINNAGYIPYIIKDGLEAFEFLIHDRQIDNLPLKLNEVDFIILDLFLPNISGNEILQELKLKNNKIPIMIFSSDNRVSTIVKSIKSNNSANFFYRKKDLLEDKENLYSILKSIDLTFNKI